MLGRKSLFPKEISAIVPPLEHLVRTYLPGGNMDDQARDRRQEQEEKKDMDAHKGLTYFDNFDEILKWKSEGADPIQRASVPLLVRDHESSPLNGVDPKLLVVHDGKYHDYEASGVTGVMEEDFTMDYLQSVETFVYYSKHLVTIPPPTWTNLLHSNGVKCLGTLYIDRQTLCHDVLFEFVTCEESPKKRYYVVAEKLAKMARTYGFDGWLISISAGFDSDVWDSNMMIEFLRELRAKVFEQWKPEYTTKIGFATQVIWHDSLITENRVAPQDTVTEYNVPFLKACGSILTGFRWTPELVDRALEMCVKHKIFPENIYFAVNVWAQNEPTTNSVHQAQTWPRGNGGGTNTALAAKELREIGKQVKARLGVAIFGPSWVVEHFSPEDVSAVSYAMWDGGAFPDEANCECPIRGTFNHELPTNFQGIAKFVYRAPAGTESFLWTDFDMPFANHPQDQAQLYEGYFMHSQLPSQSVAIKDWRTMSIESPDRLMLSVEGNPARAVISIPRNVKPTPLEIQKKYVVPKEVDVNRCQLFIALFELSMVIPRTPRQAPLELNIRYRCTENARKVTLLLDLVFQYGPRNDVVRKKQFDTFDLESEQTTMQELKAFVRPPLPTLNRECRLVLMDLRATFPLSIVPAERPLPILEIHSVAIAPFDRDPDGHPGVRVDNIRVAERGGSSGAATAHLRLEWDLRDAFSLDAAATTGIPVSPLTGRVAYCNVLWEGKMLTRVHGSQLIMTPEMVRRWESPMGIAVTVVPVGFGGRQWIATKALLSKVQSGDGWVMVDGAVADEWADF